MIQVSFEILKLLLRDTYPVQLWSEGTPIKVTEARGHLASSDRMHVFGAHPGFPWVDLGGVGGLLGVERKLLHALSFIPQ